MIQPTQIESYLAIQPKLDGRYREIISLLSEHPEGLTAWEMVDLKPELPATAGRQYYAPRLTELSIKGILVETEKVRIAHQTKRPCRVYQLRCYWEKEKSAAG